MFEHLKRVRRVWSVPTLSVKCWVRMNGFADVRRVSAHLNSQRNLTYRATVQNFAAAQPWGWSRFIRQTQPQYTGNAFSSAAMLRP